MLSFPLTRRRMLKAGAASLLLPALGSSGALASGPDNHLDLSQEEAQLSGGRIGLHLLERATGKSFTHRGDERFAICSTFKWLLAAMILAENEQGKGALDDMVEIRRSELVSYSPVTGPLAGKGATVRQLCAAAVATSDNTAANLLLARLGGPGGYTRRLRSWGDETTRLDRWETALNENLPNDPRDTTTPRVMTENLGRIGFGDMLSGSSRGQLRDWMIDAETGKNRLRANVPAGWVAGDKTGTSGNGAVNDVGFFIPPTGSPIMLSVYVNAPDAPLQDIEAVIAGLTRRMLKPFV